MSKDKQILSSQLKEIDANLALVRSFLYSNRVLQMLKDNERVQQLVDAIDTKSSELKEIVTSTAAKTKFE